METDPTQLGIEGEKHPTISELKDPSQPHVHAHLASCSMCRSVVASDELVSAPIPLDLPKGLVSEAAFRWPALSQFNWALDWLDIVAGEHPDRTAIRIVEVDGAETQLS